MGEDLENWLQAKLPKWLQTVATSVLSGARIDDKAVSDYADLCIAEERGESANFEILSSSIFDLPPPGEEIRLRQIAAPSGVNALDSNAVLDFGNANLCVVYGQNGTGKSGFARITKHAANARAQGVIESNVFTESPASPEADFVIDSGGSQKMMRWEKSAGPLQELKHLHVFDSDVARTYLTEKAEASYEPLRLRFLQSLVDISDRVKTEIQRRANALPRRLPAVPSDLQATELSRLIHNFRTDYTDEYVKAKLEWKQADAERATALQEALNTPDPEVRLHDIDKAIERLDRLRTAVAEIADGFTPERISAVTTAKAAAMTAREAVNQAATATFRQSYLPGIGESTWRAMWDAARQYATTAVHPSHPFPQLDGARCPLCQQDLSAEAGARLSDFENFVNGELEKSATRAEAQHKALIEVLPKLPLLPDWKDRFSHLPETEQLAETLHADAIASIAALADAHSTDAVPVVSAGPLLALLDARREALASDRALIAGAQAPEARAKLQAEQLELRMRKWCDENITAILDDLNRFRQTAVLDGAIRRTNTTSLTKKKNELAEAELVSGYQQRFEQELTALGGNRIRVKPIAASRMKGQIKFALAIDGAARKADPVAVLSEGEARLVALAAFLADVSVAGARTPFLFDDPISSLDVEFEERVVERLVALAKTRQVLVFTHRLSLATLLKEEVAKAAKISESSAVEFKEIFLWRLGARVGLTTPTNFIDPKLPNAANSILNEHLPKAKKAFDDGAVTEYFIQMKSVTSQIRIIAEAAIEGVLIGGVVKRFRRRLITQDKLSLLAKITLPDCTFLEELMTRYSTFEHSQPDELPSMLPSYEEVYADVESLSKWVNEFKGRKLQVPADNAA